MNETRNNQQPKSLDYQERIRKNKQLLFLFKKLQMIQESCWGKFFRFQKSSIFTAFQKKMSVYRTLRIRLDDIIFIALILVACLVFYFLPFQDQTHYLVQGFRNFLIYLILASVIWLISDHWFRHVFFVLILVVFPVLTYLVYNNIIVFDPVDSSESGKPLPQSLKSIAPIMGLVIVFVTLYLVYPMKQFIRGKIGSLFSYLFALSFLILFIIWPLYSLISEYIASQTLSFNFLTQNQALIITFIVIIIFSFHLLIHNTFFEGDLEKVSKLLMYDLKKGQIQEAVDELTKQELQESFIYQYYEVYTRIMSVIILLFTLLIEIYSFIYLSNNLEQIMNGIGVMAFALGFLAYGSLINRIGLPRSAILYFSAIISLIPAYFSSLYYTLQFYQYLFLICCLPYTTIFWCIVRSLSHRKPFLKINVIVILYVLVHIPITLFIVNNLKMLTQDQTAQQVINYIIIGILVLVFLVGVISFIVWLCFSVKQLPNASQKENKIIDYNYFEPGNPPYVPYKKEESFSLEWLGSLDIRNVSQIFSCICYICCQVVSVYMMNQLLFKVNLQELFTAEIYEIVVAQLLITWAFLTYFFIYIVVSTVPRIAYLVVMCIVGIVMIAMSYISIDFGELKLDITMRLSGGVMLGIGILGIPLEIIKRKNEQLENFLPGIITILIWILLIIPYGIVIPIISIYVPTIDFGEFIYYVILASTALLLILVSLVAGIFNMLLGKFQQEKKMKYLTEDVAQFLKQEGISTQDEALHILYESFQQRDRKYVFFLKQGYPVRLYKQPQKSKKQVPNTSIIVYTEEQLRKQSQKKLQMEEEETRDNCWKCLTCFCGLDDDQLNNKIEKAHNEDLVNDDQLEELIPREIFKEFFQQGKLVNEERHKKQADPSKINSSKSIILKHLLREERHLGEEYALLSRKIKQQNKNPKTNQDQYFKNRKLSIEIWHIIFEFIANHDDPPSKIIYTDFMKFCEITQIIGQKFTQKQLNDLYFKYANTQWKTIPALSLSQFSLIMEAIAAQFYSSNPNIQPQNRLSSFLLFNIYPMLSYFSQFTDSLNERKVGTRNNYSEKNKGLENDEQLKKSPFLHSYKNSLQYENKSKKKNSRYLEHKQRHDANKLIQPNQYDYNNQKKTQQKIQEKVKEKSCKKMIYEKYLECQCCHQQDEEDTVIKRKNIKPWEYLSVQCVRILERKELQWREKNQEEKTYQLRPILNNILIAIFKLADLYTYLEITVTNPKIGWQSLMMFSIIIIEYRYQFYICLGLVVISIGVGIKGISYILEDRLGLTETRVPASFPHPMFFFTTIYKLLILALFNTMILTLLTTFMCNWQNQAPPYHIISKGSMYDSGNPLECFSLQHNIYIICALIALLTYYPLSAYTMPNFQFAEKTLDLKYKSTYMILYFQVNFILAAGKVLLSQILLPEINSDTPVNTIEVTEIVFQSLNILSLLFLAISVRILEPCLIKWFNYVQMMIIVIGLVWNVMGLVLYLTDLWEISLIIAISLTVATILFFALFIKKTFFSKAEVAPETDFEEIKQLQMNWKTKQNHGVNLVRIKKQDETEFSDPLEVHNRTDQKLFTQNKNRISSHQGPIRSKQNYRKNLDTRENLRVKEDSIEISDISSENQ